MSARPIGSATISFGLVSVPVKLYSSAESAAAVSFNMLHKACATRLKQQYICPKDGVIVEKDDIAKGYEFSKGQYVLFSPEELKTLEEKATNSIDIAEFVPLTEVDRIYLEKVYYLGPDKGGDRAYRLLSEALRETGRAALGQYAARGQQHLVLVRPMDGVLVMEQLHYANELRPASEVPLGEGEVKPTELALAKQLIEQTATDEFHPERYSDQVRSRVLAAIQQKVDGQEITGEPVEETGGKIIDLMEALKASLARPGKEPAEERKPAKRAPAVLEKADKPAVKKRARA
jgi:DNA end-binding protein Ku